MLRISWGIGGSGDLNDANLLADRRMLLAPSLWVVKRTGSVRIYIYYMLSEAELK